MRLPQLADGRGLPRRVFLHARGGDPANVPADGAQMDDIEAALIDEAIGYAWEQPRATTRTWAMFSFT